LIHPRSVLFAEIGAGQEVARWFLFVGGASGTVAKTISAYDKEVSDDLYGSGSRYVSEERLEAMLDNEWSQLLTQLSNTRGQQTRFSCFVDTVIPTIIFANGSSVSDYVVDSYFTTSGELAGIISETTLIAPRSDACVRCNIETR
jgi:hypothetical protein